VIVLQRKASMQQNAFLLVPVIKGCIYIISTHFLTSQPALIKLDNENIGGHLTPLQSEAVVCQQTALGVKLCVSAGNGWPHVVS